MLLDFPAAPLPDQVWEAPSGYRYQFDGVVWVSAGGSSGGSNTGGGLTTVAHDATMTGDGTNAAPLSVVDAGGIAVVTHDNVSLTGEGTPLVPLAVAAVDAGGF